MNWIEQTKAAIDEADQDIQTLVDELGDDILKPDIIILEHEDLDDLIDAVGGPDKIRGESITIYTDDGIGSPLEYNLISFENNNGKKREGLEYTTATQIHRPQEGVDSVLNLTKKQGEFVGLMPGIPKSGEMIIERIPEFTEIPAEKRNHSLDNSDLLAELRHDERGRLYFLQCPDGGLEVTHLRECAMIFFQADSQTAINSALPTLLHYGWEVRQYDPDLVNEKQQKQFENEDGIKDKQKLVASNSDHAIKSVANELGMDDSEYHVFVNLSERWHYGTGEREISDEWRFGLFTADQIWINVEDVDAFIEAVGGVQAIPTDVALFADEEYSSLGKDLINVGLGHEDPDYVSYFDPGEYGLDVDLSRPGRHAEVIIDLRYRYSS